MVVGVRGLFFLFVFRIVGSKKLYLRILENSGNFFVRGEEVGGVGRGGKGVGRRFEFGW